MRSERSAPLLLLPLLVLAGSLALPAPPARTPATGLWSAARPAAAPGDPADAVPGELIVKFRSGASLRDKEDARGRVQGSRRKRFRIGAEHWALPPGTSLPQAIAKLRADPRVAWAEPNYRLHILRAPDDARYPEQWALHNTGQDQGQPGADIRAEGAWDSGTGSRDVVVAVIDTGVDYTHPDLAANIWDNEGEIAGNDRDDDGNGFVDDVRGWDFVNADNDPIDDAGHGTHVAGIIGAAGGNGEGVAGVAWQVRLMPVKFLGADGGGSAADAVAAVEYATRMGARIMNNSWGGGSFSQALLEAIEAAAAADCLFVVAAGNNGTNNDLFPTYPASYDAPNVLSVAASDRFDHLAVFSNYGAGSVDLAAPGAEILSTVPGARYAVHSGTSMAAPHVSGVAALVRAAAPEIDVVTLRRRLLTQVDPIPGLTGALATGGRLNAALTVASPDAVPPAPIADLEVTGTTSNTVTLRWTAPGDDGVQGTAQSYDLRYATFPIDADTFDQATPFAGMAAPQPAGTPETVEVTGLLASTDYAFALRARDEWGNPGGLGEPVVGITLPPPRLDSAPAAFAAELRTGQSTTRSMTLRNAGEGTLDWSIPPPRIGPAGPALRGAGGPDPFGYRFIDSDEPAGPVFTWTDLRIDGVEVGITGDDSLSAPIPLGFAFPFYEDRFDLVRICSNGFLSFTNAGTPYANQPLPSQAAPENLVAPFWDDLFLVPTSKVVYRRDPGRFLVQYDGVMHYDGTGPDTFQVELRATGEIEFRYRRIEGSRVSATVGIQDRARSRGLQIAFNAPYLHDDLAVHIDAVPQWLSAAPALGRLGPGETAEVTVGIDATALGGGTYEGTVLVLSNDPAEPRREHPVTLRVTDAPAIAVAPPLVDFGTVFAGFASQQLVTLRNVGTAPLTVAAAGSAATAVTTVGAGVTLEPGATVDLTVIWAPPLPAALDATLMITSDAANRPLLQLPLRGSAVAPPAIGVAPAAFVETLDSGGAALRTLTLTNAGPTGLDFHLRALSGPAGISAGSSAAVFDRLSDSPQPVTCLVGDPDSGLVYCQESQGSGFLRLRLSAGTWEPLAPAPFAPGEEAGAAILGGRIVASWAGRNSVIGVYDIAARTWSTRVNPLGLGTAAIASDGTRWVYLVGATTFVRYDPAGGAVEVLPAPPFVFGFRGGLRFWEGSLYGHAGGGSTGFARYDIAARTWETLAPIPGGGGLGAAIDPWSREYATAASGGRGIARYAFDARAWSVTAVPLFSTGDGGLAWMPSPAPGLVIARGRDGRQCARLSTAPGFLTLGEANGRVPGAGAVGVAVRIDSAGLPAGDHRAAILVESNDPRAPAVTVPVSLTVVGAPDLRLLGDTVTVESTQSYAGSGAATAHTLTLADPPGGGAALSILAEGDYGDAGERAAVTVEGIDLGAAGGTGTDCTAAVTTFPVSDAQLAALTADGQVEAQVRNAPDVGDLCGLNRHTLRLTYAAAVDRIEFGEVFTGTTRGRAVVLKNQGTAPLRIASIAALPDRFVPAIGTATLAPGETLRLEVQFSPAATGATTGSLRIASDDPDQPLYLVPLSGAGATPPRAVVQPAAIARTLLTNQAAVETLRIANPGGGPLHWSVAGRAAADAPGCRPTRLLATQSASGDLASIDLLTGAVAPVAFGLSGPTVGIDVDAVAGVAYVAESNRGTVAAVDLVTGAARVVAADFSYPVGVALDAPRGRLFVNDGAPGTIVEIDLATGDRVLRAGGLAGTADLAMAPGGGALYIADNIAGRLLRMDTTTGALTTLAFGLGNAAGLELDPAGNRLLVAVSEPGPGRLLEVDLASGAVRVLASGLARPAGVALAPGQGVAWVAEQGADRVVAIDLTTGATSVVAPVPADPAGLVLQPDPRCRVDFLAVAPLSGIVPPGGEAAIDVRIDATGLGSGAYDGLVAITTDDPGARSIDTPVRLTVVGAPDLVIAGEEIHLTSSAFWVGSGAATTHDFRIDVPPGGGATLRLDADGDFGAAGETATLEVEGSVLGAAGGIENDCQPAHATLTLAAGPLAAAAVDGVLHVAVRNSADVNQVCLLSRHTIGLTYNASGDQIEFGEQRIGSAAVRSLTLFNRGTDSLQVASITSDRPAFTVAPGPFTLPPGGARVVEVRLTPGSAGAIDAALTIRSDDPDTPIRVVPMHAVGRIAPEAVVEPESVEVDLESGVTESRVVRLRNTGGSDLVFAATLGAPAAGGAPGGGAQGVGVLAADRPEGDGVVAVDRAPAAAAAAPKSDLLLVQEALPWGVDTDATLLSTLGIPFTRSTAAGLATADLSPYRMILVAGDQRPAFYAALPAAMPRLAAWVAAGGVLQFHAAAWGTNAGDASGVILPGGVRIEEAPSPTNTLPEPTHPLTAGVPGPIDAHWASHAHFRGLPPGTARLAVDTAQVETLVAYRHGVGAVIATGQPLEFSREQAHPMGVILSNAVGWARGTLLPPWLEVVPPAGVILPGGEADLLLTLRPGLLAEGDYRAALALATNDPSHPGIEIPVGLSIAGEPHLALLGESRSVSRTSLFGAGGATDHILPFSAPPGGGATLVVAVTGDFGGLDEYAEVWVEGMLLGRVGGTGVECAPTYQTFNLTPGQMATFATDGVLRVEVRNSDEVDLICGTNQHAATLTYNTRADRIDFDSLPTGAFATRRVGVANVGTDVLSVALTTEGSQFAASPAGGLVSPGGRLDVDVRYTGGPVGDASGTLIVTSNDSALPSVAIPLAGLTTGAPSATVDPQLLTQTLHAGLELNRVLTLSNHGLGDLNWRVTTLYGPERVTLPPFLSVSPVSGLLSRGRSVDLSVHFDTDGQPAGEHHALLYVVSNDPVRPNLAIPVTFTVLPGGHVVLDTTTIDFGEGFVGLAESRELAIGNRGTDPLRIDVDVIEPAQFTVAPGHLEIPPGGDTSITVAFLAPVSGLYLGQLRLRTDDPLLPEVELPLRASAIPTPQVGVWPTSLSVRMPQDGSAVLAFSILNGGESAVTFATALGVPSAWCPALFAYYAEKSDAGIRRVDLVSGNVSPVVSQRFVSRLGLVVDSATRRAWAADYNNGRVKRVDLMSGSVVDIATGLQSPLGLAIDKARGVGYVTEEAAGRVVAFSLTNGLKSTLVQGLPGLTGLALGSDGAILYAARELSSTQSGVLLEIDPNGEIVRQVATIPAKPFGLAVAGDGSRLYVVETPRGAIAAIDIVSGTRTEVACCMLGAAGIALDTDDRRAFVTGQARLFSVDLRSGAISVLSNHLVNPSGIGLLLDTDCPARHMTVAPAGGTVAPSGALDLEVRLDAIGAPAGTYEAWIEVTSNDPVHPLVRAPILVEVTPDTDHDGWFDPEDNCRLVPNPVQQDGDGDGVGDACDLCRTVSDPAQADSDSDGQGDLCDPCTDTDEDGLGNPGYPGGGCAPDNCPDVHNVSQADADTDGIGDSCDPCTDPDHDGTRSPGYPGTGCPLDTCPDLPNPDQADSDHDQRGDACDTCPLDPLDDQDQDARCADQDNCPVATNPLQEDADGDRLGDACDNCPTNADPDQTDFDRDGRGNLCDGCPLINDTAAEDLDADGVGDRCDNCPLASNPGQADRNGDRSGDACQPDVAIESIRPEGDPVVVRARITDPQGEPWHGEVSVYGGFGGKALLTDALNTSDCALAWLPDGIPGRGIGFANASLNLPALFDIDSVLGCENLSVDWGLAAGTCSNPSPFFDIVLSLEGMALPASICLRAHDGSGRLLDVTVLGYDDSHLSLAYGGESLPLTQLFEGSLPRSIDLTGFEEDSTIRVVVSVTDDHTPPVFAEATFQRHDQRALTFGQPPLAAIATAPVTECDAPSGGLVRLDGRASSDPDAAGDPDGGIARFEWIEDPGGAAERALGEGALLDARLGLGPHRVGLLVTDQDGESALATIELQVVDTTAPAIDCPAEVVAECAGPEGAAVTLRATAVDACGAVSLVNDRGPGGGTADATYPLGTTAVSFTATDAAGRGASCVTRVVVRDTVAPTLTVRTDPSNLWPANRRMVPVRVTWESADRCTPAPAVTLVSVESSDPDVSGRGDRPGDIEGAVAGQPVTLLRLRAERLLTGPTRTYTVRYVAKDAAGNATPGVALIVVKSLAAGSR